MEQPAQENVVTRVLVVGAHPDDPEFACGATSALWAAEGKEIYYLVCTRGHKGTSDRDMTTERLIGLREGEQRAAAGVIGACQVDFLDFTDGELTPNLEFRGSIVEVIRRVRPDIILTHDPTTFYSENYINHPDHRAVGTATLDAIYPTARDRLQFPAHEAAGLLPHKVKEVYLWGSPAPNTWIDVSSTIERKIEALRHHVTQVGEATELAERIRERSKNVGAPKGIPFAEAFFHITMSR